MRAARRWIVAAAAGASALAFAGARPAAAGGEGVRLDQMQPASPESPFFRAEGPHEALDEGVELALRATVDYAKGPLHAALTSSDGSQTDSPDPVDHALLLHLGGSLSPAHWPEIDLSLPVALLESGAIPAGTALEAGGASLAAPEAPALGDLRVGLHFRPVDAAAFGLLLGGRFWAPIGEREGYLSDKRLRGEVDLGAAGQVGSVLYGCTFSVAPGFFLDRNGDRAAGNCGLHFEATTFLSAGVEPSVAIFRHEDPRGEASLAVLFEPLGAVRVGVGGFRVGLGAGPGFGGAAGTAELRALLSVGFSGGGKSTSPAEAKHSSDTDLDTIPDDVDACVKEAGPDSRDPAKRGCPSLDRDADGIRDDEDWCSERPGVPSQNRKANGCPDSDNDDLPDPIDACPNEPGAPPSGCPRYARLVHDAFRVDPPVAFSDAALTPIGRLALEEIAATMRANPKIELLSLGIGTKAGTPELADERARNVILVFREGNLDTSRYEVVLREDLPAGSVLIRTVR